MDNQTDRITTALSLLSAKEIGCLSPSDSIIRSYGPIFALLRDPPARPRLLSDRGLDAALDAGGFGVSVSSETKAGREHVRETIRDPLVPVSARFMRWEKERSRRSSSAAICSTVKPLAFRIRVRFSRTPSDIPAARCTSFVLAAII